MAATLSIEEIENVEHIKYNCSKHGIIIKPIKSFYYTFDEKEKKIIPHFDVYCPACIEEFYNKLAENDEIGTITYEAEYKDGYTPKPKKKTGEIEG